MAKQNPRHRGPKKTEMQSMHTVLKLVQLRWTGHDIRMPDERFLWKITGGKSR